MLNCLKHFDILKEGSNSIASYNIFICVTLYLDIYMTIFMHITNKLPAWYNATPELLTTYNGCTDLNYTKHLTPKSDHLIIQDIKNIIQN